MNKQQQTNEPLGNREKQGKTALVLAGGGLAGAVYEIGALRAIDDLMVGLTVNDFDIYVGTSAGALVSSLLAAGFTPAEMLASLDGHNPHIPPIQPNDVFDWDRREVLSSAASLPMALAASFFNMLRMGREVTGVDWVAEMAQVMPSGMYDGHALSRYIHNAYALNKIEDDFRTLSRKMFIIATNLDNGERAVFGPGYQEDVPVSLAAAASAAVPILYKPVRIGNHDYIDGGMRGNASLDLAVEQGAKLVVCVNPLRPMDASEEIERTGHHVSDQGIGAILAQVTRIITHSGLVYHVKQLRRRHPDVDLILIEPRFDDTDMFFGNIMRYSTRLQVARHGFESATLDLAEEYARYKAILARHGIEISRRLVIEELAEIHEAENSSEVLRRVLEKTEARHQLMRGRSALTQRLENIIQRIEQELIKTEQPLPPPSIPDRDLTLANGHANHRV